MMNTSHLDFPTPFESKRLILRSYQPGDGQWFYEMSLRNHEHLQRYEADNTAASIQSEEAAEALVCELADDWNAGRCFFIGAFDKKTGEFVAQIYVGVINRNLPEYEIGYFADVGHEGQGFVSEGVWAVLHVLFDQMNTHRVSLRCDESNLRSMHVAKRCKMVKEGCLRENRRNPDGSYSNSYIYGLLKSEFLAG